MTHPTPPSSSNPSSSSLPSTSSSTTTGAVARSGGPGARFSLLLAVWAGDHPDYLERALRSSVHEQTRRPDELVVVEDGPLPARLAATVDRLLRSCPVPVRRVRLTRNLGLGPVLDAGLAACSHDIVARIDADDLSLPHRFEVQVPLVESGRADLVGSALLEFERDEQHVVAVRVPPTAPRAIVRAARLHDPFNHPSVVYRRSAVQRAGGYQDLPLMEDYWLFARMIAGGARVANVPEPLVLYRVGDGAYDRRGGLRLLVSEVRLQWRLRRIGFTTPAELGRNVLVRGAYRLVPASVRRPLYRALVAQRGPRLDGEGWPGRARGTSEATASTAGVTVVDLRGPAAGAGSSNPPIGRTTA
jgi:glycosyltransferase involved in cell wall biosynthesis